MKDELDCLSPSKFPQSAGLPKQDKLHLFDYGIKISNNSTLVFDAISRGEKVAIIDQLMN